MSVLCATVGAGVRQRMHGGRIPDPWEM
ncbi:hypothetical protein CGRA01v4_09929 [Colletotrichum graminicola]|nr:hypothetical protein CGRA01v4_09929 [Colletotrichum graminicola]